MNIREAWISPSTKIPRALPLGVSAEHFDEPALRSRAKPNVVGAIHLPQQDHPR